MLHYVNILNQPTTVLLAHLKKTQKFAKDSFSLAFKKSNIKPNLFSIPKFITASKHCVDWSGAGKEEM